MGFPVILHGYDNWIIKKAEGQRFDAFELCCWRRLLRDPWTARRSNQSILKEISPEYSLEVLRLKLNLQYFGTWCEELIHWKKTLMMGMIEGRQKGVTEDEMLGWHHWLHGHEFQQALIVGDRQGSLAFCCPWGHKELDMTEQLNWADGFRCYAKQITHTQWLL